MSKLSYRLGFALLVLPACSNPAPGDTDGTSDTSTTTSTTDDTQTTTPPTTEPPTTSTTETSTTSTSEPTTTEPVTTETSTDTSTTTTDTTTTTSTDTTDSTTTEDTTTTTSGTDTETSSTTEAPDQCADGEQNGDETDIDCGGGVCSPCAEGGACLADTDCASQLCVDGVCAPTPPSCMDGQKNGNETDIDCGGDECPACADDLACVDGDDCLSQVCTDDKCVAATCDDTVQNGEESDVDCGGPTCDACLDGDSCDSADDCASGVCDNNVCSPATCDDTVKNGAETDVDCGGADCDPCGNGLDCGTDADCESGFCIDGLCVNVGCLDGIQNGQETGVDCGGPDCAPCSDLNLVINEVDYDQINSDNAEFIELLNATGQPIDLAGHKVVLISGNDNKAYATYDLSPAGTIEPGQYLVLAKPSFVIPAGVLKINFSGDVDRVQNGSPDGIALVHDTTLVDALSYEGGMTMANTGIAGLGVVSLVEGTVLPMDIQDSNMEVRSLVRLPNGSDSNDAATDWALSATPTPGAANVP
ncbi:lamin tail domain-containing protein [Nannocystis radixulma]|uniref:Lamin tail domain-containing protein n=1 Tax=Nannocystis radixulma TaxID=2995305 RepID=A0ABT5B5A2_9BACT|nr:lamin tail domain-containing protein [Nannocystis radixulma]MDC0668684.1 lamin tail domain-containing protein [Nannocystis radixulma]